MIPGGIDRVERVGLLFELAFGFLLLPLVVATMDSPPLWLGARFLLWLAVLFLVWRMPSDARSRMLQRMRPASRIPGGWVGPLVLFLLSLSILAQFFQVLDVWSPPAAMGDGGLAAELLLALVGTLFAVLPMEILFRVYFPVRFPGLVRHRALAMIALSGFFFAWFHIPALDPVLLGFSLLLGCILAVMERLGWPFWGSLGFHGLAMWSWIMAPRFFTGVF